jgi:hypothetical protein
MGHNTVSDVNVQYLRKIWRLFKSAKIPNYDHLRWAIKANMLRWADNHRCWIEEGVYFDNKTLDKWINLKFNPGDSTAIYSSANKGISILKCRPPRSGCLKEMHLQEEIWDATKGNTTFVEMTKQLKKDMSAPALDFGELRSNIATFCALLFTLFGEGCDLYKSIVEILQTLSHQFSMQNKSAYTPEVCRRITWAIIIDSHSFFNNIKLAEDFLESGQYMQFPVSMLQGDYMAIKHGIKIQSHNFPQEWITKEFPTPTGSYYGGGRGGGYQPIPPGIPLGTPPTWGKPISPSIVPSARVVPYRWQPAGFIDRHNPKIAHMMEPLITKHRGRISVSSILMASNKRFDDLPKFDKFPNKTCWLHALAVCPYGTECLFATGHLEVGDMTDSLADKVVLKLQPGVTALVENKGPPSPRGKRKWGGRGGEAETPQM